MVGHALEPAERRPAKPGNIEIEAARFRCAAVARASPGSISPRCAKARAGPRTTSRSRTSSTRCCWAASPDRLNEDAARRFVNLIDELYDRHVNLVCTASTSPIELYTGQRLQARSNAPPRLIEMQRRVPGYPAPGVSDAAGVHCRPTAGPGILAGRWPAMIGEGETALPAAFRPGRHMRPRVAARRVIPDVRTHRLPPPIHRVVLASFITVM